MNFRRRASHEACEQQHQQAMEELAIQIARASKSRQDAERLGKDMAQIRAALSEVGVYEGLVGVSPTALLVSELARDHEELEARIDAVLHYLSGLDASANVIVLKDEIARLLRGGKRVPDSLEGL